VTRRLKRGKSGDLDIAPASATDVAEIAALLEDARRWLAARGITQWTRPFTADWIAERVAAGEFWIARHDGVPLAVVRLLWTDPLFWQERDHGDAAYVHTLAVRRDCAGQGIGAHVLRWVEDQARARGRRTLRLDCAADNPALLRYYERQGFTPVSRQSVGPAIVILLEKPAHPPSPADPKPAPRHR
jgi:ribosomal protein S18 acetylase RimI-like enzyme